MKIDFIKNHKTKKISLDEIKFHNDYDGQKELTNIVNEYLENSILIPIKSSGLTFEKPHLYQKYLIVEESDEHILEEIGKIKLLNMNYYRRHPNDFEKDKKYIYQINDYFFNRKENEVILSVNERSLEVFGDEKFLSSKTCTKLLTKLNLSIEQMNIYFSPEIFMYYKNNKTNNNKVLIVENKDTWTTMRNISINEKNILGYNFDAIIYGEGRKIQSSFSFISDAEFFDFNSKNNLFYYFGDLDSSGIDIFFGLKQKYENYKIIPFKEGYSILIENMNFYGHKKMHEDETEKKDIKISTEKIKYCFNYLDDKTINKILTFCNKNYIVPQEVLNNRRLMEGCV